MTAYQDLNNLISQTNNRIKNFGAELFVLNEEFMNEYQKNYNLLLYELLSHTSNYIKNYEIKEKRYNIELFYSIFDDKIKIKRKNLTFLSIKIILKYFLISLISTLKNKKILALNSKLLDIVISSNNHLKQIDNHLFNLNNEFLLIDIDLPWKSRNNKNKINVLPLNYYCKILPKLIRTMAVLTTKGNKVGNIDYLQIRILLSSLGKLLIYQYINEKNLGMNRLITTKNNYFDLNLFTTVLKKRNRSLITYAITHGIIEDPLYYNSSLDNLYVLGEFDKTLMKKINKNTNITSIKRSIKCGDNYSFISNNKILVLLTAGDGIKYEYLNDFFKMVKKTIEKMNYSKIIIRPHPKSNIKKITKIAQHYFRKDEFEINNTMLINEQIQISRFCISMYSSILLDVSDTGIPLLISKPESLSPYSLLGEIPYNKTIEYFSNCEKIIYPENGDWFNKLYYNYS